MSDAAFWLALVAIVAWHRDRGPAQPDAPRTDPDQRRAL